ncbi:hypothetical protein ACFPOH_10180 [Ureibacillus suwonensis]|uniref:Uncharacterized protein n=1 Tax=Ureibacillus suwonensis TaxID=313007 RepID=A0ABW0RDN4_9BACL
MQNGGKMPDYGGYYNAGKPKIIGSADKFITLEEKHCRMADIRLILADITMPGSLK